MTARQFVSITATCIVEPFEEGREPEIAGARASLLTGRRSSQSVAHACKCVLRMSVVRLCKCASVVRGTERRRGQGDRLELAAKIGDAGIGAWRGRQCKRVL